MLLEYNIAPARSACQRVIAILMAIVLSSIVGFAETSEADALYATRDRLRKEGFKLDLTEFDFTTTVETRSRMAALTNQGFGGNGELLARLRINLSEPIEMDSALVVWKEEELLLNRLNHNRKDSGNMWPGLQNELRVIKVQLDAACAAAFTGPIRFHSDAGEGFEMLVPHLEALKSLGLALGKNLLLELHYGHNNEAWTNLLASTRLVTAWQPESTDVSNIVWFGLAKLAFENLWQALQAQIWTDEQLTHLQHEWETVRFLTHIPEIQAFTRACMAAVFQQDRQQPIQSGITAREAVLDPGSAWNQAGDYLKRLKYHGHGSFADEEAVLLHYQYREREFKRAIQRKTWLEMRRLPGVTNDLPFQTRYSSAVQSLIESRQALVRTLSGGPLLAVAAEAESRRRILLAAIALERFHLRERTYPETLRELIPDFLTSPPVDFIDGQPLRYRRTQHGQFILYSVGLDGVDNGGILKRRPITLPYPQSNFRTPVQVESDLVWPRPAALAEVEAKRIKDQMNR
ncbi:MAG: hypothetical protein JWM99_3160 [Verrucomicrobiales bacterium]|nr:hypothetical protein [Verrucomicrobiales bacterium]